MRLLIVDSSNFKDFPAGGVKYFLRNFLRVLPEHGEADLIGITTNKSEGGKWRLIDIDGKQFRFLPVYHVSNLLNNKKPFVPIRVGSFLGLWRNLFRIDFNNYDVAYIQFPELAIPFILPRKKIPVVFHLHGLIREAATNSRYAWIKKSWIVKIIEKMTLLVIRNSDKVLTISSEGYNLCIKHFPNKASNISVVPAMVDERYFYPKNQLEIRKKYNFLPNDLIFIFTGRLAQLKGLDILLKAFKQVLLERPEAKLILAGSGDLFDPLKKLSIELQIEKNVYFMGEVEHDKILPELLNCADLFVFTSIKGEGFPSSILEALACGVPIVSTAVGNIPNVVIDGYSGFLIQDYNLESIKNMIMKGIKNKNKLRKGALDISQHYSAKKIAQEIIIACQSVI